MEVEYLKRYRKSIEIVIWFLLIFSFFVVNLGPLKLVYQNLLYANAAIFGTFIFTFIYYYFIVPKIESSRILITSSIMIYTVLVIFLIWLSGAEHSLLVGLLSVPIIIAGIMLGLTELLLIMFLEFAFLVPTVVFFYQREGWSLTSIGFLQLTFEALIVSGVSIVNALETSRRVREQAEIKKQTKKWMEISKIKDDFVAMSSHNLRTPVGSIKGYLDILLRGESGKLTKDQKDILEKININNERLFELVEEMINISVLEAGSFSLFTQPVDLEQLISESVANTFEVKAKSKGLVLTFEHPEKRLPLAKVDTRRFKEALFGLIDNAIKFTKEGKVIVSLRQKGDLLEIAVADTGPGISKKDVGELFQKFHRIGSVLTYGEEGTGLGLYTAKLIIEAHGGEIWVDSEVGKGSTFNLTVPIVREDEPI